MGATRADFPNTSWQNVSEPVSSAPGPGKIGFSGKPIGADGVFQIGDLQNLGRLAGGIGALFGTGAVSNKYIEEATKVLQEEAKKTTQQIDERIGNIYPALTGLTGPEAMQKYYDAFADTVARVQNQGRTDLGISPDLSTEYNRLGSRVDNIQNQYSLAGRLGGYEKLALEPPVVSMDVSSIRGAADWGSPEMAAQFGMMTDYSAPQTSRFIYGGNRTADAIGKYYNTSGDVAGLMNYGTLA